MRAHLIAALVTALFVPAATYLIVLVVPAGCDERGPPEVYRWTCLFPGLAMTGAPIIAAAILLASWVFGAVRRLIEERPIPTALVIGVIVHIASHGIYWLSLNPAYRRLFAYEAISIPQPFTVGLVAAAAYVLTLWVARRMPART